MTNEVTVDMQLDGVKEEDAEGELEENWLQNEKEAKNK